MFSFCFLFFFRFAFAPVLPPVEHEVWSIRARGGLAAGFWICEYLSWHGSERPRSAFGIVMRHSHSEHLVKIIIKDNRDK